ncbi:MAG: Gx transporter family protein [Treponema sp.]|nr:Gx transporter family protein [Treponema sp.]
MQSLNKNRIAYLASLTLLFSYAEMLLPKFFPFFKLGLGNIAILLALSLDFPSFLILTVIKALASSIMGGTLISPFFIISLSQSVISGLFMYIFFKIRSKWLSIFGISMIGSAVSALVQIILSTIYLGKETLRFLGPMLIFSLFSGILIAALSRLLKIPEKSPVINESNYKSQKVKTIILSTIILTATITIFMINNLWILLAALAISFICQILSKRKILITAHLSIFIFVILISLLTPSGKVLFSISSFNITLGALENGLIKALKLSSASALSQCAASLRPSNKGLLGLTLSYYRGLSDKFKNTQGKLFKRIQETLTSEEL